MSNSIAINNGAYVCSYSDDAQTINSIKLKATEKDTYLHMYVCV